MALQQTRYPLQEFSQRGSEIYERDIRAQVESDNKGKFAPLTSSSNCLNLDASRWLQLYPALCGLRERTLL